SVVGPFANQVHSALLPIQPLLDVLNAPIPGLSDLSHAAGQGDVSILSLAKEANKREVVTDPGITGIINAVGIVNEVDSALAAVDFSSPDTDLIVDLGSFQVGSKDDQDLQNAPLDDLIPGSPVGDLYGSVEQQLSKIRDDPNSRFRSFAQTALDVFDTD